MMKRLFKISLSILVLAISLEGIAQQQYMLTQYMYNGLALNPAYAGIHGGVSLGGLWREQWTAIKGAPSTQLFSIHSPLNQEYASVGAMLYRDVNGVKTEHTAYLSYAYRIKVSKNSKLSMGLQGNLHNYSNDIERLNNQRGLISSPDLNDPLYQQFENDQVGFRWNFGTGLMWHSDKFYLGASVPQILNRQFYTDLPDDLQNSRFVRHMFIMGGYVFNSDSKFVLKPNFLVKAVEAAPVEVDLNLNVLVSRVLWLGVSLRSEFSSAEEKKAGPLESVSLLAALQITPAMQIGYAFDFTTTSINTDSHEIMLNYIISLPARKILTPRYF